MTCYSTLTWDWRSFRRSRVLAGAAWATTKKARNALSFPRSSRSLSGEVAILEPHPHSRCRSIQSLILGCRKREAYCDPIEVLIALCLFLANLHADAVGMLME